MLVTDRRSCSGQEPDAAAGHMTSIALVRRESPSIMLAACRFEGKRYFGRAPLWDSAKEELRAFSGVTVLSEARWDEAWLSGVSTDVSPQGIRRLVFDAVI